MFTYPPVALRGQLITMGWLVVWLGVPPSCCICFMSMVLPLLSSSLVWPLHHYGEAVWLLVTSTSNTVAWGQYQSSTSYQNTILFWARISTDTDNDTDNGSQQWLRFTESQLRAQPSTTELSLSLPLPSHLRIRANIWAPAAIFMSHNWCWSASYQVLCA